MDIIEVIKLTLLLVGAIYLTINCRVKYDPSKWPWN